jgi:phosphohistidine phosphatase
MSSSKKAAPRKRVSGTSKTSALKSAARKIAVRKPSATRPASKKAAAAAQTEEDVQGRERFIVLLRHGIAEEAVPERPDEDRSLTAEGHARMKSIARGLERAFPKAESIHSSPLLRATQTAHWVSKAFRSRATVKTTNALTPGSSTAAFLELIASLSERRTILVGHEPNLTDNLHALLGDESMRTLALKKGGCYGVRLQADGSARLEWILSPRLLRKLGE